MALSDKLWDLSGQAQNPSLPTGSRTTGTTGTVNENTTQVTNSNTNRSVNTQNTPQFALNALQALITQLSDHPAISLEQAEAQAPSLQRVWTNAITGSKDGVPISGGWLLQDPLTGRTFRPDDPAALQLNQERAAQRQQIISSGGVIAGGTIETQLSTQQRQTEISRDRAQQGDYTKEAAFADASALQGRFTRQLLEQLMPQITRAVESSGTSGGTVAGLMAQDAASRTAEAQAALGLQTAVQYGQVSNQLASTLELLTRSDNPTTKALLEALGLARGTVNIGSENTSVSGVTQTSGVKGSVLSEVQAQTGAPIPAAPAAAPAPPAAPATYNTGPSFMQITNTTDSDNALMKLLDSIRSPDTNLVSAYNF